MKKIMVFGVMVLISLVQVSSVFSQSGETNPPDLYSQFSPGLFIPVPLSPLGVPLPEGTETNVTFEWTNIIGADTYVLWIEDTNKKTVYKILKPDLGSSPAPNEAKFECNSTICKTSGISLTSREGKWWVQAIKISDGKKSGWSKAANFKTSETAQEKISRCVKEPDKFGNYSIDPGDLPYLRSDWTELTKGEWTVGLAALAQIIKYDFAKKKAGFNNGLGAGTSFRFYRDVYVPGEEEKVPISRIKGECRASTFQLREETDLPDAAPVFSITPVIFASQLVGEDSLRVEPALMLGFFEDIVNIGVGFNLTGKDGEKGDVFLLFSIGAGFNF